jgi:NADH:ubiquinone oxidoreductase subunit 2 (subunit N)
MRIWILFFSLLVNLLLEDFVNENKHNILEFPIIFFSCIIILLILSVLLDLFAILITLETLSFIIIGLSIVTLNKVSLEANIKYFVQNTVVSGISIFGIFGIYFITKNINFFLLKLIFNFLKIEILNYNMLFIIFFISLWLISFFFKLGIVPFHFYVPNIYKSSPIAIIYFFSTVLKPTIFFTLFKIYFLVLNSLTCYIMYLFIILGLLSILIGNINALYETNIKKFLGYTSISQFGFFLICLSIKSIEIIVLCFFYLFFYCIFLYFIVLIFVRFSSFLSEINNTTFKDLYYIIKNDNFFKVILTISVISISGLPPTIIFIFKYIIFLNIYIYTESLLILILLILNIISIFYYFRFVSDIWVLNENLENIKYQKFLFNLYNSEEKNLFFENTIIYFSIFVIILTLLFLINFDEIHTSVFIIILDLIV